jgi:hypothetical protein
MHIGYFHGKHPESKDFLFLLLILNAMDLAFKISQVLDSNRPVVSSLQMKPHEEAIYILYVLN